MQPLFYFPSTMICIDDHPDSIAALNTIFKPIRPINTFQDPQEALHFLNHYHSPLSLIPFLRAVTDGDNIGLTEYCPVDLNVLNIAKLAEFSERNKEISLLVIDYNMPEINGIELCRALKGTAMKKILLTGENNYKVALAAFNERIIDNFIQKDSPTLVEELIQSSQTLSHQYFLEKSQALLTHLEASKPLPLSDKKFIVFFEAWRNKNNITEYYLIDKIGSFLCFNHQGEKIHFIVHTESSLKEFSDLYEKEAGNEIPDLFQKLHRYEEIPFFGVGRSPWEEEVNTWVNYFYVAENFEGREIYYWVAV